MQYQPIPPPDTLKNYIRYFWILESNGMDTLPKKFRTMADGCPGLVFQQPEKGVLYRDDKQLPATFLYGQATQYAELQLKGAFSTVGIFFYPNALRTVFGLNAQELTDTCIDLDPLAAKQDFRLSEQLSTASSATDRVDLLSAYLLSRIEKNNRQEDKIIQHALQQMIRSNGSIALKELQQQLQLSERSIERKFKEYIGISPKLFARICRFQASLNQLRNNQYGKLSDIAFENEYADQSHFIRSFKEFAGFAPYRYQQTGEIVENLSLLTK